MFRSILVIPALCGLAAAQFSYGCYTEGAGVRALSSSFTVDYVNMTIEMYVGLIAVLVSSPPSWLYLRLTRIAGAAPIAPQLALILSGGWSVSDPCTTYACGFLGWE
jgi:hypothetical protein